MLMIVDCDEFSVIITFASVLIEFVAFPEARGIVPTVCVADEFLIPSEYSPTDTMLEDWHSGLPFRIGDTKMSTSDWN